MKQRKVRERVIRIKLREILDGVTLVREHLPPTVEEFRNMGLVKDGIFRSGFWPDGRSPPLVFSVSI